MGMFDYKKYSSQASAQLISTSQKLAIYSNAAAFFGLPGDKLLNGMGKLFSNWYPNKVDISIPKGWREINPSELKLSNSSLDKYGYYTISSPATGDRPINGAGPQAKILGEFKNGKLVKLAVSWAGTNDLLDFADYFKLNNGSIAPHMEPLLNKVKEFAIEQGLKSEDILITGYSLGGGMTNVMAKYREVLSDGFFKDSDYVAHASPLIYDNADVIFNFGFKNDAVFRILGDASSFKDAVEQMNPGLVNPDISYSSATNNLILFTGAYSSPLWKQNGISMSILNTLQGWSAHRGGAVTDAVDRIIKSPFYDLTNKDSRVIVDHLNGLKRLYTWVEDKSGDKKAVFIIGNDRNNLLKSGKTGDYIDAGGGKDKIKPGEGADVIHGGSGVDKVILQGKSTEYDVYRMKDGTLFMQATYNNGLKQLHSIEKITFDGESFTGIRPYDVTSSGLKSNRYLIKSRNVDVKYKSHTEGTEGEDQLSGKVVFGLDGDDTLTAHETMNSLLHGGKGDDVLVGGRAADKLYGAEGNDLLYAGAGSDLLYGGVGHDIFYFDKTTTGTKHIKDFNQFIGDKDTLLFSEELFATKEEVLKAAKEFAGSVTIAKYKEMSVIIDNASLKDIENSIQIGFLG